MSLPAFEQALNWWLQTAIVLFALGWWGWWGWRRLGLPPVDLAHYFSLSPRKTVDTALPAEDAELDDNEADEADERTADQAVRPDPTLAALQLDRTRAAVVKALVRAGWSVSEIRGAVRGANDAIGQEIEAARAELEGRVLRVRDGAGERVIVR